MNARSWQAAAFILLLLPLTAAFAASDRERFSRAYAAYQQHRAANQVTPALESARDAYQLGTKLFGKTSVNTANLAGNYAALLNETGQARKARRVLKGKLEILEQRFGADATELVPVLTELGRANLQAKTLPVALGHFQRAATLAKLDSNPLFAGQRNFDIAKVLMDAGFRPSSEPFMQSAHDIYKARLQSNDIRLGLTSYQMAMWALSRAQHDAAVGLLTDALTAFKTDDEQIGDLERTVRYRLVETYETLGASEAATEHCIAVGARQAWVQPPAPLFRKQAVYPEIAREQKLSGEVVLGFTIDPRGFVVESSVIRSSNAIFDSTALDMISQFRYAPRFEDGNAVATGGLEFTARFDLSAAKTRNARMRFQRPPIPGFPTPAWNDPANCGDPTDNSGRCDDFGAGGK